jgi:autophagy-related protein 2
MAPIHVFVDLSLVERLLPMLRSIAPAIRSSSPVHEQTEPVPHIGAGNLSGRNVQDVIDDYEGQTARHGPDNSSRTSPATVIRCPTIRLDIRCPAPPNRRGSWGDGAHLRSGIVTLDIHGLSATLGSPPTPAQPPLLRRKSSTVRAPTTPASIAEVECQKMILFFCRAPGKRSVGFLSVGPLTPDPQDKSDTLLLPTVTLKTSPPTVQPNTTNITCRIPSVRSRIHKPIIEGLQFFADDLTHWLDGAFGDGSRPRPRDELKMIGSRFFGGSKASSESESVVIDDVEIGKGGALVLRVLISEVEVGLVVREERVIQFRCLDVDGRIEVGVREGETGLGVSVMDGEVVDVLGSTRRKIIGRTTPLTLTLHNSPLLHFRFTSSINPETISKESDVKLELSSTTVFVAKDFTWMDDLVVFLKTPEGVFEDVEPTLMTRVRVLVDDCSIHLESPNCGGGMVVNFGSGEVKTELVSGSEEGVWEFGFGGVQILVIDVLLKGVGEVVGIAGSSSESWKVSVFCGNDGYVLMRYRERGMRILGRLGYWMLFW